MPASPAVDTRANIDYATHDGVTLLGDLYLPTAGGPFPALVAAHGGGWQAGARSAFQYWGPYLAARGYVLFAVSYRLAKKGHKAFPQAVTDLLAAVQFVRGSAAQIKVDPERIGLFGASAGAHLAALAALGAESAPFKDAYPNNPHASLSSKVRAFVGVYGVYDVVEMWQRYQLQSPRENNIENFMGCAPMDDPRRYFEASPVNYATFANNQIGVFLSVGTEDDLSTGGRRRTRSCSSSSKPTSSCARASRKARRTIGSTTRSRSRAAIRASWRHACCASCRSGYEAEHVVPASLHRSRR
jgi:acetyl esterase/lipase